MTTTTPGNRLGLLGRKVGMMRIFTDDGDAVPVTVLDVSNNRVAQVKTVETDGYTALQLAYGTRKASRVTKPEAGHLAKAGVEAGELLKEFRVAADVDFTWATARMLDALTYDHRAPEAMREVVRRSLPEARDHARCVLTRLANLSQIGA